MSQGAMNLNLLVFEEIEKNERKKQEEVLSNLEEEPKTVQKASGGVKKKGGRKKIVEDEEGGKVHENAIEKVIESTPVKDEIQKTPEKNEAKEESKNNTEEKNLKKSARKRNRLVEILKLENEEDSVNDEIVEDFSDEDYKMKKGIGKSQRKSRRRKNKTKTDEDADHNEENDNEKILSKVVGNKNNKANNINNNIATDENNLNEENAINAPSLPTETVIDLTVLNAQEEISNTEMILAIIEICVNSTKYEINADNKTREFWKQVYNKDEWDNILKKFQSETLRKYWRIIRDINNYNKIIEVVHSYSEKLNGPNVRLLPVINAISSFISSNSSSFDSFISQLTTQQNLSVNTKEKKKLSGGASVDNISNSKNGKDSNKNPALNKKRKREDAIIEDIEELNKKIMETNKKKSKKEKEEDGKDEEQDQKGNVNEVVQITTEKKKVKKAKGKKAAKEEEDIKVELENDSEDIPEVGIKEEADS